MRKPGMLNKGKAKGSGWVFVCPACGHIEKYYTRYHERCDECPHIDLRPVNIDYAWRVKPTGYTRLIPNEDIARAKSTLYTAKRNGVTFTATKTFAGLLITITSIQPYKYSAKRQKIERELENL